jgi:hypothetical protein
MKKHYETHVEDTDKLISVAGPVLDYKSWYEQYRKLMEEQAQRKHGLYTPTSEGDDDDFPSIPGMVARYSALGLTNEQMAENPVWKDLTDNGHDLQMKNLAWKGMSGVGGYVGDFSKWVNNRDTTEIGITKSNSKVIIDVKVSQGSGKNIVFISKSNLGISNNVTIKITSTYPEGVMKFANSASNKYLKLPSNGIITLQDNPEYTSNEMHLHLASADLGQITIEQLPLYPGALVFDGVDDWAGCDNLPLLPKEKGYSIIALRNWITRYDATRYKRPLISNLDANDEGAFLIEYRKDENVNDVTGSYNSFTDVYIDDNNPITWQTSSSYNGQIIKKGTSKSTNKLCICKTYFVRLSNYANAAIWEIVILDHDATEEELTKIKDYFVKTYPWLFPNQAWTVTGKTNEDEDRATIANITGNGNDLVLSNFGFAEGSGYGLYAYNFNSFNLRDNVVKPTDVKKDSFRIIGTGNSSNVLILTNESDSANWKIRITGMKDGDCLLVGNANKRDDYVKITKDGIYTFQKQYAVTSINGIWYNSSQEVDVLVEQIPEYEGYLVTDGVDDEVRSAAFTLNEDWTIVGNWEFITNENKNAGLTKVYSFYLYNRDYGIFVYKYINAGQGFSVEDVKSLKAICSDGRIYLNDWQEIRNNIEQEATISKGVMAIGYFNRDFTKIALKNLGIYNDQLLSKDDCIKAYNYLQTLKAK